MTNSFLSALMGGKSVAEATETTEREPTKAPHLWNAKPISARRHRRIRIADMLSDDKKRERARRRQARAIQTITEAEAVRRVRLWEAESGRLAVAELLSRGEITIDDVRDSKGIPIFDVADRLGLLVEDDDDAEVSA